MKRITLLLAAAAMLALPVAAFAGDYHVGATLPCYDCHTMHYSESHPYSTDIAGFGTIPLTGGPHGALLRQEPNDLCLACHNNQPWAPDVFGQGTGPAVRISGGLNAAPGHLANDDGYDVGDGHSLWSTETAPGGTYAATGEGLECVHCHAQHGIAAQYRNLLNRGIFSGKALTYAKFTNDLTKDVYERAPLNYDNAAVDFNEPDATKSAYGNWCATCHNNFHGSGGSPQMGGITQGWSNPAGGVEWIRHPTADVNIGSAAGTHISSLAQFNAATRVNRVKVLDSQGLWNGTAADNTVTPSCMSCHKAHGNKNSFGLIFMGGVGTVTEEGDDGALLSDGAKMIALCRQCHIQGSTYATGLP
jgi:hypothetical protein